MAQSVFKRYELKYLVNREQHEELREVLSRNMELDKFCMDKGSYTICNIYFDNQTDDVIRNSISKPYYKEKLRLRSYGLPGTKVDIVFLELKKKIGGIVSKRRVSMSCGEAISFIEDGSLPQKGSYTDKQVSEEISAFQRRFSSFPKVFLSYERTAFRSMDDSEFRVTFDNRILTRRDKVSLGEGDFGIDLLDDNKYLMEVKIPGALPLWFVRLLSDMEVFSAGFSKYGEEYKSYIKSLSGASRMPATARTESGIILPALTA